MSRQRAQRADPAAYRPPPGLSPRQRAAEQDLAAGGRAFRLTLRPDGSVVAASIALRGYAKSRRVYAYLRWAEPAAGTAQRYVGDFSEHPTVTRLFARRGAALSRALSYGPQVGHRLSSGA